MKVTNRKRAGVLSACVTLALLGSLAAGPAYASTDAASADGGVITATTPGTPSDTSDDAANLVRLKELAKTQTQAEINAIVNSGEKFHSLLGDTDPASGHSKVVAAFLDPKPAIRLLAISTRGPGCATSDGCASSSSGVPHGYYGSGKLGINITGITKIAGGDRTTTFWFRTASGRTTADFVAAGETAATPTVRHYTQVSR